jgi:hypothetical protein
MDYLSRTDPKGRHSGKSPLTNYRHELLFPGYFHRLHQFIRKQVLDGLRQVELG